MASSPQPAPGPWPALNAPLIDWARAWCARGYHPKPLEPKGKRPIHKGWPVIAFEQNLPLYFGGANTKGNIGVACGPDGHTDLDIDADEALLVWKEFFAPATGLRYGRSSKPDSHWFYYSDPPIAAIKYQGLTILDPQTGRNSSRTILEVRCLKKNGSIGLQSMVPGSIHPSGEHVRFEPGYDGDAARVDAAILQRAAALCAAAVLLAWNFPDPQGGRHDAFLALAGALGCAMWDSAAAIQFHSAIYRCLWPHDADFGAARREVEDTYRQLAAGTTTVTGYHTLAALIDAKVLQKAFGWLGVAQTAGTSATATGGAGSGAGTSGTTSGIDGFRLALNGNRPGVYFCSKNPAHPAVFVCSPMDVLAVAADQEGGAWSRLLRWHDLEGREQVDVIPMELLAEPAQYRRRLLDRGLLIATGPKGQELLGRYLQFSTPSRFVRITGHIGWHERSYVLPGCSIGPPDADEILFRNTHTTDHYYRTAGTFAEWQKQVAAKCRGNSCLLFSMSCPFAAPLLAPLGAEPGGFHFINPSSTGKTTAQIVAGSAIGGGKRNRMGFLDTWRATSNGLEITAEMHSDNLLLLNELSEVTPQEAALVVYMLAHGTGRSRMSRQLTQRPSLQWQILFLSSGEIKLSDHIASVGKRVKGGAEIRLLNIPGDAGAGLGLFETLHGAASPRRFAEELAEASVAHYGHAQRAFLEHLVRDYQNLVESARQVMNDFLADNLPQDASAEIGRGLRRIALVVAGGELATQLGITTWSDGEASWAGRKIFEAWLASRGGTGPADMDTACRQVRAYLEAYGESRFEPVIPNFNNLGNSTDPRVIVRAGFFKEVPIQNSQDTEREYLFLPEVFRAVCQDFDHVAVALELERRGYLRAGKEKRHPGSIRARTPLGASTPVYYVLGKILTT